MPANEGHVGAEQGTVEAFLNSLSDSRGFHDSLFLRPAWLHKPIA